jgi:YD repeat-containing protein
MPRTARAIEAGMVNHVLNRGNGRMPTETVNIGNVNQTRTFAYDALDRLIPRVDRLGRVRDFTYDGNQIALQFDKTGSGSLTPSHLSHRYLWGASVDQILADEALSPLPPGEGQGEGGQSNGYDLDSPGSVLWTLTGHLNTVRDLAVYTPGEYPGWGTTAAVSFRRFADTVSTTESGTCSLTCHGL